MSSVVLSLSLGMYAVAHTLTPLMITWSEVARIFCQGEQTSVFVSHQQMNGI